MTTPAGRHALPASAAHGHSRPPMHAQDDQLSTRDYARLCELIYSQAGIHLNEDKRTMVEARVKRRLKNLHLTSYHEYCNYLFSQKGHKEEMVHFIDVVTTNKTDFFREPRHFEFLTQKALPDLIAQAQYGRPMLIWSAGCSTGEEPYTMAIVLSEYAATHPGFRFRILATDICTTVLEKAQAGVYTTDVVAPVPPSLRTKYFMRSRDRASDRMRVVPELRETIDFRRLNFMDNEYGLASKADAIFCRNVIIYFDRPTQQRILGRLAGNLVPNGYMFVGHSETLHDMNLPLTPVAPATYRRVDARL